MALERAVKKYVSLLKRTAETLEKAPSKEGEEVVSETIKFFSLARDEFLSMDQNKTRQNIWKQDNRFNTLENARLFTEILNLSNMRSFAYSERADLLTNCIRELNKYSSEDRVGITTRGFITKASGIMNNSNIPYFNL